MHRPDIPYEDHRQTKDIIRMLLQQLHIALGEGKEISSVHGILKEIKHETAKLEDTALVRAIGNMEYLINHNWPLSERTSMEVLQELKGYFLFIDEKTLF